MACTAIVKSFVLARSIALVVVQRRAGAHFMCVIPAGSHARAAQRLGPPEGEPASDHECKKCSREAIQIRFHHFLPAGGRVSGDPLARARETAGIADQRPAVASARPPRLGATASTLIAIFRFSGTVRSLPPFLNSRATEAVPGYPAYVRMIEREKRYRRRGRLLAEAAGQVIEPQGIRELSSIRYPSSMEPRMGALMRRSPSDQTATSSSSERTRARSADRGSATSTVPPPGS